MTLIPPGAHLGVPCYPHPSERFVLIYNSGPVDLPPPSPQSDPREPSPSGNLRRHVATPSRPRSPIGSRGSSPVRPIAQRSPSADPVGLPPVQPVPRTLSPSNSFIPTLSALHISHPHLSRPSSPSSVHSSTSAIFERDIELPAVASLSLNPNPIQNHSLNHKSSRLIHGSALDHTVPAVLDDAVEALAGERSSQGVQGLEVEAPMSVIPVTSSRKPSVSPGAVMLSSRSSSPVSGRSVSPAQSPPILRQLVPQPMPPLQGGRNSGAVSPANEMGGSVPAPVSANRTNTSPQLPGGWAFGGVATDTDQPVQEEVGYVFPMTVKEELMPGLAAYIFHAI